MTINDKLNLIIRMQLAQIVGSGEDCGSALIAAAKEAIEEDAINDDTLLDDTVTKILLEIGSAQGYAGWRPAVEAIKLVAEDPHMLIGVTKGLYHEVADICGIDHTHVERNIRNLIDRTWDRCDYRSVEKYFGNSVHPGKGRPTVKEFIARIADAVNREIAGIRG